MKHTIVRDELASYIFAATIQLVCGSQVITIMITPFQILLDSGELIYGIAFLDDPRHPAPTVLSMMIIVDEAKVLRIDTLSERFCDGEAVMTAAASSIWLDAAQAP